MVWHNTHMVTIPIDIARDMEIAKGDMVEMTIAKIPYGRVHENRRDVLDHGGSVHDDQVCRMRVSQKSNRKLATSRRNLVSPILVIDWEKTVRIPAAALTLAADLAPLAHAVELYARRLRRAQTVRIPANAGRVDDAGASDPGIG